MSLQSDLLLKLKKRGSLDESEQNELQSLDYQQTPEAGNFTPTQPSQVSADVATNTALQSGANPLALALARKQLGDQDYIGYCESFVESVEGTGPKGGTALEAWQNQHNKAVSGLSGIKPGDEVYFYDPNQPDGHTGVYAGGNEFISATYNGIQQNNINKWTQSTGQQVLGYIPMGN